MFIVERVATFDYHCPNGHAVPMTNQRNRLRFCPVCRARLEEESVLFDGAFCDNCRNEVDPTWEYCPYCGKPNKGVNR